MVDGGGGAGCGVAGNGAGVAGGGESDGGSPQNQAPAGQQTGARELAQTRTDDPRSKAAPACPFFVTQERPSPDSNRPAPSYGSVDGLVPAGCQSDEGGS